MDSLEYRTSGSFFIHTRTLGQNVFFRTAASGTKGFCICQLLE
jgi:hypothetical protein